MTDRQTLYLIDGSGYIFRAYYAIRPLSTRDGLPTNAVIGFGRMLAKLLRQEKPDLVAVVFDEPAKTFRHDIYDDYKANRDSPPEDLIPQFGLIRELVDAMDIPRLSLPGFEADDVLATLAKKASEMNHDVVVVSGDKDLMQVVTPTVIMLDPMKDRRFDPEGVRERFGVPPELVADAQALAGDSSDNIPGVPKVGPKSAAKLVAAHGDIESVIAALEEQPKLKAFERSVLENRESARMSKRLTTLATDAPIELELDALVHRAPTASKLGTFLRKIEAFSMLRDFGVKADDRDAAPTRTAPEANQGNESAAAAGVDAAPESDASSQAQTSPIDRSVYKALFSLDDLKPYLHDAQATKRLSIDLETTSLDATRADIVGVSLCTPGTTPAYIPVAHRYLGVPLQLKRQAVLDALRPVLESTDVGKVGQNLKYDMKVLLRAGVRMQGIADDSLLAAYCLDPSRASFSLDSLAREILGHETIRFSDVAGKGKKQIPFDEVDVPTATEYAAEDADVALRLCDLLPKEISATGLDSLYRDLELPLLPVLAEMESTGVRVDTKHLEELAREFQERLNAIEKQAHEAAGETFNLASPKQLSHLFFEKLGYPVVKKTKTGFSTDHEVLQTLAKDYELPSVVLQHRTLAKLKSTYVDTLIRLAHPETERVHTTFNQTGAATGRLSSTDPNLQNIPVRSEDGRRIRAAFVAEEGWELISADYSQIELRVMAHLSGDERFIDAFVCGEDIHSRTAREVLTDGAEPDADARRRAKAINFGILYGLSEFGLSKQLGIPRREAAEYIATYFARYPGIRIFLDRTIEEATSRGYVTTLSGRRRYLPNLSSRNKNVRQGAERVAMNTPIQGSAADLIKEAMIRVHRVLTGGESGRRFQSRLLLQVHDELVIETPVEEREEVMEIVRNEMSGVRSLSVPLTVDVGYGPNWSVAH